MPTYRTSPFGNATVPPPAEYTGDNSPDAIVCEVTCPFLPYAVYTVLPSVCVSEVTYSPAETRVKAEEAVAMTALRPALYSTYSVSAVSVRFALTMPSESTPVTV